MYIGRIVTCMAAAGLGLCMLTPPKARADAWNQKTVMTFNEPVEIPGRVLPAGTYVFKLIDSQSDRNVVEVQNQRENHTYGIFLAIPDYQLHVHGKTIVTFEERAAGSPQAIKAWFYPGDNYGHEFVYPKVRAQELAKVNQQTVTSMPNEVASNTSENNQNNVTVLKQAPLTTEQPQQMAESAPPPPPPVQAAPAPAPEAPPAQLPQTGSDLPLIALIGALSLGTAGSLRYAAAKMK